MDVLSAKSLRLAITLLALPGGVAAQGDTVSNADAPSVRLMDLLEQGRGIRVESTSPALGSVGIRMQGLPGQYTALLVDGLPLLGAQGGELGIVQLSALDVQRVDVVAGPAMAVYGSSALGGVVNLVSRRPNDSVTLVFNQTSQDGTDATAWLARRFGARWGATILGGVHRQGVQDVNRDAWADVPGFRRVEFRPRLFWSTEGGASLIATVGGMSEARAGGTLPGATLSNGQDFAATANTNRADGGFVIRIPVGGMTLDARASTAEAWERQAFGPTTLRYVQHGRHETTFAEATVTRSRSRVTWILGAAYQQTGFHSHDLAGFEYTYRTPSVSGRAEATLAPSVHVAVSGRCGWEREYGGFCSPRVTVLVGGRGSWSARLSGATGSSAPTPFLDETEGIPLARLVPFTSHVIVICNPSLCASDSGAVGTTAPFSLVRERARYGSLDVTRRVGALELGATLFLAQVDHPLILSELNPFDERPQLVNAAGPIRTAGAEVTGGYEHRGLTLDVGYAYLNSTTISPVTAGRVETPLTPRHSADLAVAWRSGASGPRVVFRVAYTGRQRVFDDPYRTSTPSFTTAALGASFRVGVTEVYLRAENLNDVRQTHYDPLLTAAPSAELQWTTEVWAPLEGRIVTAGVRLSL